MIELILLVVVGGGLALAGFLIRKAVSQIAAHVQRHPEAGQALYEHLFLPLLKGEQATNDRTRSDPPAG